MTLYIRSAFFSNGKLEREYYTPVEISVLPDLVGDGNVTFLNDNEEPPAGSLIFQDYKWSALPVAKNANKPKYDSIYYRFTETDRTYYQKIGVGFQTEITGEDLPDFQLPRYQLGDICVTDVDWIAVIVPE